MTRPDARERVRNEILQLLGNHGDRAFRAKEIAKRLDYRSRKQYLMCREVLESLADEGRIASVKGGRFAWRRESVRAEGVLSMHRDGFGFVTDSRTGEEYFVPAARTGTAIDGDRVRLGLDAPPRGDRKRVAEVVEVLERGRKQTVGTFRRRRTVGFVTPDDRRIPHDIVVDFEDFGGAEEGDKVIVSIDAFESRRSSPEGRVLQVLGSSDDAHVRTLALAMAIGVKDAFPAEALAEAEAASLDLSPGSLAGREDFRELTVFTIDPEDARDFDDALHWRSLGDGRAEVGVHIADVSHYVREGSALDHAAAARSTSVYLVDRVIPMLPERLSADLCSLRPGEDRLTYSCVFTLDADARVLDYRITPSIIHSKRRLTYEQAQEMLDGQRSEPAIDEPLRALWELAEHLTRRRLEAGAIDFDLPEVRVVLDADGIVTDIVKKTRKPANRLIEEFMLLANLTVAGHTARWKDRDSVYRIHDPPDRERIKALAKYVGAFGYPLKAPEGHIEPAALNALLRDTRDRPEAPVIQEAALRAMSKARYDPENAGHFGLALPEYTHFTSPIRRYPDLLVHRFLRAELQGGPALTFESLKAACDHASDRERVADEAQRASVKLKQVEYMQQHVGESFSGVVSGVSRFGVFVELDALIVEGMVHVRDMSDDYYEYDESGFALTGRSTGRRYRLGDAVRVVVAAAKPETREIDFLFD